MFEKNEDYLYLLIKKMEEKNFLLKLDLVDELFESYKFFITKDGFGINGFMYLGTMLTGDAEKDCSKFIGIFKEHLDKFANKK